jgi:signal transduction histidine kinase
MRSTEPSGVGSRGVGKGFASVTQRLAALARSISPVTYAIALTGLLAATIYVVTDIARTLDEAGSRDSLVAAEFKIETLPAEDAYDGVMVEVTQRGTIAFSLALLLGGLGFRRKRRPTKTETQPGDADVLSTIREQQRVLARRYHEEKLRAEAASRSKTSFLAHLSHDIRTPLNHIIGFAELMRHQTYGPLGDPRYVAYVESISLSGDRLLSFFASILDLAELEGGRRTLQSNALQVDDLLSMVTRRFSSQAQRAHLTLALGAPCGASLIGDRFSLERMLGNLVDNAIRFTPAGGKVSIASYAAADGVVLEVSDTGIGMGPERLATLSQPFAFGDAALTKDREGTGLGLAIARTIAELSGGRLAIDSRPGLGTTVAVSLPLRDAEEIEAAA